jgi:hypothetical protein
MEIAEIQESRNVASKIDAHNPVQAHGKNRGAGE